MPIKFRCCHCHQRLGISKKNVGRVVNCPACGRSLRVPAGGGRAEPAPKPTMDSNDAELKSALNELATIGRANDQQPTPHQKPAEPVKSITPVPPAAPISVEPLLPADPIDLHAGTRPRSTGNEASLSDQVAELDVADPTQSHQRSRPSDRRRRTWRTVVTLPVVLLMACVAMIAFMSGYLVGQRSVPLFPTEADANHSSNSNEPNADGNESGKTDVDGDHGNVAAKSEPKVLRGRIIYETPNGESRPDVGARVIVFSREDVATAKLSVKGFRTGDKLDVVESATTAIRAIGGDLAVVDERGEFRITLANAGTYPVLVLSGHRPRDDSLQIDPELRAKLETHFQNPDHLIRHVSYHFALVRYDGNGTLNWDHSFDG